MLCFEPKSSQSRELICFAGYPGKSLGGRGKCSEARANSDEAVDPLCERNWIIGKLAHQRDAFIFHNSTRDDQ